MPRQGYTHIQVLLDRSGSMQSIKTDMEGGFNTFITEQRKEPGHATVGLTQFDTSYEPVYAEEDLSWVPRLVISPRGGTALIDALCQSIDELGSRLSAKAEIDRPETVLFIVITDGEENSSRRFTRADSQRRIKEQEQRYGWVFTFLGANQDAIKEGANLGFSMANSMTYDANHEGTTAMAASLSSNASSLRGGGKFGYTDAQRKGASRTEK